MRRLMLLACALPVVLLSVGVVGASRSAGSAQTRWVITDLGTLGGRSSHAVAINEHGQIVGNSVTAQSRTHAFVWQKRKMTDLGTLGGPKSRASEINDHGQIVGYSSTANGKTHAFLWQNGRMSDLGQLPGGKNSSAVAINNSGQIVGTSDNASGWGHAFLWQKGKMRDLGTLGGKSSSAKAINQRGDIVGESSTATGNTHAVLWRKGKMIDLGTLGHGNSSTAVAINARDEIGGTSRTGKGDGEHAFIWRDGKMLDLGDFGVGGNDVTLIAMNDAHQVLVQSMVGTCCGGGPAPAYGFLWHSGKSVNLGTLSGNLDDPNYNNTEPFALNQRGQVVGRSTGANEHERPFLWQNDTMTELGASGSDPVAWSLNERDEIIGSVDRSGYGHAVLWTLRTGG